MSTTDDKFPVTGLMVERQRGLAAAATQPGHTLPLGTRLRDFEITGLVGEGGFGIVYLAWDHSLQRRVAVKEYMPTSMVARVGSSAAIVVKSERHVDTFKAGLKSFVNEARLLARFNHPSLVKVYRFWEDNGTAYMVMPYYEGPTLKAALASLGHVPSENEIRAWLKPVLNALALMHAAQCYHRDIAPDNILLTPRGPLLLDFGAARRVIGDMTHAMTVVLKPGFAPIEQYGDVASMAQGPWTDLYALACVVYFAITGKTPMSSVERLMDDRLEPLSTSVAGQYSPAFLRAIDAALSVRPADRPQNDRQFRALLDADQPPPFGDTSAAMPLDDAPASLWPALLEEPQALPTTVPGPPTTELATQVLAAPVPAASPAPPATPARPRRAIRASARPLRRVAVGLCVVATVAALAAFWWVVNDGLKPRPRATEPIVESAPDAAVAAPSVASQPMPTIVERAETPASPSVVAPATSTTSTTTTDATRTPRPRRDVATPHVDASADTKPTPTPAPTHPSVSAKCSDILQKASLESLSAEESAYLKKECR